MKKYVNLINIVGSIASIYGTINSLINISGNMIQFFIEHQGTIFLILGLSILILNYFYTKLQEIKDKQKQLKKTDNKLSGKLIETNSELSDKISKLTKELDALKGYAAENNKQIQMLFRDIKTKQSK